MSAIEYWKNRVECHHAQSIKVQGDTWSSGDFWSSLASNFRADPHRTEDPVLDRLFRMVRPESTVLDVGGGAGRLALPLALRCKHVTVAEPSDAMLEQLRESAQEAGIENLSIVQATWDEAETEAADTVVCAHVVYGVEAIEPFIRKLVAHASKRVAMFAFFEAPPSRVAPFWRAGYGEERINMPALPELLQVVWEMDIYPDVEMLEAGSPQTFDSVDEAIEQSRRFLWVMPDTEQDKRYQEAARELLVETPEGFVIKGARPRRQGLISWRTD